MVNRSPCPSYAAGIWSVHGIALLWSANAFAFQSGSVGATVSDRGLVSYSWLALAPVGQSGTAGTEQGGSIRGVVYDKDFDVPLAAAQVAIVETGARAVATPEGNFVFSRVPAGKYTLIFSKDGYARQVKADITVVAGQLTDADISLSGEFTEMEEFVVQDVQIAGGESELLQLRLESPALMDSIGADLMRLAGASDAGAALNLIAGASVQDGKYAVIRGLPDRYVTSQLNGVRLPTADEDKRAVQLDQFPAAVIDSVQVSKTFTPDQQGDASGGAVNVVLKGLPDETTFQFKSQVGSNSQVVGRNDFLTYAGGGLNFWGKPNSERNPQTVGTNWDGAAGVSTDSAPIDSKWSLAGGTKGELADGITLGGFASFFYERDSSYFNNGINNSLWVTEPGAGLTPETIQGTPTDGDFKTRLFDVTQGTESVQWGGLGTLALETENNKVGLTYLFTRSADDTATLAQDTRGKEYYFPGYDPNDPAGVGNTPANLTAAPYIRTETLEYEERTVSSVIFNGKHTLPIDGGGVDGLFSFAAPQFDWVASLNSASLDQPDKRQFGAIWLPESFSPGAPPFIPPFTAPPLWLPFKPAANFTLGNFQRIYKAIEEDNQQFALNLKFPFEQWTGDKGYLKFGYFDDRLTRTFNQDTYSNFSDNSSFQGGFDQSWSEVFPGENHPITDGPPFVDVDYNGDQKISAWYAMLDLPLTSYLKIIGGARVESTSISIENFAEQDATWFPPGAISPVKLNPGDADVSYSQNDVLPSIGLVLTPIEKVTVRAAFSETIARQTFKELTPIIQQEFLGGPIFIGNPGLQMSALRNFDLRLDYAPYDGALISVSGFHKNISGPIEYVQRVAGFTFTTPVNYPTGMLTGLELELRQDLGRFWEDLKGLSVGANATWIKSQVTLPDDEIALFNQLSIQAPMSTRPLTGTPENLYNLYITYESELTGTQVGLFYTIVGDTLVAGAGASDGNFVPNIFSTSYGTLNLTISQKLGQYFKLQFQAKNLSNPAIQTVYRSDYISGDVLNTSYTAGIDFSVGISAQFTF